MNRLDEETPGKDDVSNRDAFALQRVITADNALIENIFTRIGTGFVTISYNVRERNLLLTRVVTLIVGPNTRIRDQFGNRIELRDLRVGMNVNARFSSNMTRSDPPQALAFSIEIVKAGDSTLIEVGRVLRVDGTRNSGYILTGVPNDPNRQMRYVVSNSTELRDRRGNRITLRGIQPGQRVRIEREPFQTLSIPPQTTAISVQII